MPARQLSFGFYGVTRMQFSLFNPLSDRALDTLVGRYAAVRIFTAHGSPTPLDDGR